MVSLVSLCTGLTLSRARAHTHKHTTHHEVQPRLDGDRVRKRGQDVGLERLGAHVRPRAVDDAVKRGALLLRPRAGVGDQLEVLGRLPVDEEPPALPVAEGDLEAAGFVDVFCGVAE